MFKFQPLLTGSSMPRSPSSSVGSSRRSAQSVRLSAAVERVVRGLLGHVDQVDDPRSRAQRWRLFGRGPMQRRFACVEETVSFPRFSGRGQWGWVIGDREGPVAGVFLQLVALRGLGGV